MFQYLWPIGLVVLSNTFYQLCTKGVPEKVSPFASLAVTYLVGAAVSVLLHFITHPGESLLKQVSSMNWTTYVLGLSSWVWRWDGSSPIAPGGR